MIAEVSAVIGALNAVNGALGTLRETRSNVSSLSNVFSKVTTAASGIAEVEAKAKSGKITLSQKEAMDIALAKKKIQDYDKQLKDLFLMTGNMDTYNDMKRIQAQSVAAAKKRAARAKANKAARNHELLQAALIITIAVLVFSVGAGVFLWLIK